MTEIESDKLKSYWSNREQGTAYMEVIDRTVDLLQARGQTILTVGCGKGYSTCAYAAKGAGLSIGLEILEDRLTESQKYLDDIPSLQPKVRFVQGTSDALPLEEGSVDGVVMNEALSHYNHPDRSLQEAYRVLKSNGKLYIFDDNNKLDVRGFFRRRFVRWPPYHEEYDELRREFLRDLKPDWSTEKIEEVVESSRGMRLDQIEEKLDQNEKPEQNSFLSSAPRHPIQGNYAEREINPLTLKSKLEEIGFEVELLPSEFAVTSTIEALVNRIFQMTHPLSLLLSPGFTILAEK